MLTDSDGLANQGLNPLVVNRICQTPSKNILYYYGFNPWDALPPGPRGLLSLIYLTRILDKLVCLGQQSSGCIGAHARAH